MEVKQTRFVQTESNLDFSIKGNTCRQGQLGSTDFLTKFGVNFFVRSKALHNLETNGPLIVLARIERVSTRCRKFSVFNDNIEQL